MLTVKRLAAEDAHGAMLWDAFVQGCDEATFFHRSAWQALIRDVFRHDTHYLYAERGGQIEGVLPLAFVRSRLFGRTLVSLPFASYAGVAANSAEAAECLEREAGQLSLALGAELLELRNRNRRHPDWPTQDLYVAFRKPIPAVLDEKMACIPQKRRNMVRKGQKLGLRAVHDDSVHNFFPVFAANARDHGTPTLPRAYFDRLKHAFGKDCSILSVNDASGRCISSILCFFHRGEVLAYYAGELQAARSMAANDFKYWEVMKWAQARGCTMFDIGRSKRGTGSYDFKLLWGFEPQQLHYQYVLNTRTTVPQNNPSNPKYRLLIRTWQRLPLAVANRLGPMIVRSLG